MLLRLYKQEVDDMKRSSKGVAILTLILILMLTGCQGQETSPGESEAVVLKATVLEVIGQGQLLVEPVEGSPELGSADRIVAHTNEAVVYDAAGEETTIEEYAVGSRVKIIYDGSIAESYPAQIWAEKVEEVE